MTLSFSQKLIGGEQEISPDGLFYGVTNSGRSSLRWALQSMDLQKKRVLVPDFVCQVVVDTLLEYDVDISFYKVLDDFELSLPDSLQEFDALYLVRYFGHESQSFKNSLNISLLPLIIDDVFSVEPPYIEASVHWCYFNSLRKVTAIADYSQLISNKPLVKIHKSSMSYFSRLKYQAKEAKYDFINASYGNESSYLNDFSKAENILEENAGIFEPEDRSIYLMGQFYKTFKNEVRIRENNMNCAKDKLSGIDFIDISTGFPSFLPILLMDRNEVRHELMKHSIYLAVHWPSVRSLKNSLSDKILSLPLDPRYSREDIERICEIIKKVRR